jgi:two-component system, sensor histidine kinase PdtaS
MSDASDTSPDEIRRRLIGLGEFSIQKSYYPELREKLRDLERFRALLDRSSDAILMLSVPEGIVLDSNEAAKRLFERLGADSGAIHISDIMPIECTRSIEASISGTGNGDRIICRKTGEPGTGERVFEIVIDLVEVEGVSFAISVARDVTKQTELEMELRRSLEEKDALLREVNHRVKNNLQISVSLLSLQAEAIADERARLYMIEAKNRIAAMSIVHEMLYQSPNLGGIEFDAYIRELAPSIVSAFGLKPESIGFRFETEPVLLDIEAAVPCGLILNELVSNAVGHAFPGKGKGGPRGPSGSGTPSIAIRLVTVGKKAPEPGNSTADSLIREGSPSDIHCELTVEDNGIGMSLPIDESSGAGLGLKLVETLATQLGGTMRVESRGGTSVRVLFPLGRKGYR